MSKIPKILRTSYVHGPEGLFSGGKYRVRADEPNPIRSVDLHNDFSMRANVE